MIFLQCFYRMNYNIHICIKSVVFHLLGQVNILSALLNDLLTTKTWRIVPHSDSVRKKKKEVRKKIHLCLLWRQPVQKVTFTHSAVLAVVFSLPTQSGHRLFQLILRCSDDASRAQQLIGRCRKSCWIVFFIRTILHPDLYSRLPVPCIHSLTWTTALDP